jgi:RimJ/RimL family protein N-acetyltransferase
MPMEPQIRILTAADAGELFALRREALLDSPFAFLASPSDDLASSEAAVQEMLKRAPNSVVFGAHAPQLVGMLGLHRAQQVKAAHKVNLWGMYVATPWRRRGVGERLVEAAVSYARTFPGVTTVRLSVSGSARAARQLYEKIGFKAWGVEPDAMMVDARPQTEHHMSLSLNP